MAKTYSQHVGEKFNPDGSACFFPGNTVLCPVVRQSQTFQVLSLFHNAILQQAWHRNFAMLPPSSYHMTVFDLVCDQVRKRGNWSSRLPLDAPLAVVDDFMVAQWKSAPPPPKPKMLLESLEIGAYITLRLKPINDRQNIALREYRNVLSQRFGVRHPNHDSYFFHLTFAYGITSLDADERVQIAAFVEKWEPQLRDQLSVLALQPPQLCFFADMTHFAPSRGEARQAVRI